jgi:hypothetical protein
MKGSSEKMDVNFRVFIALDFFFLIVNLVGKFWVEDIFF